jgi:hypothetical protein
MTVIGNCKWIRGLCETASCKLILAGIPFIVLPDNLWNTQTVRQIIPSIVPDKYLITKGENTPAHATYLYPLKDKNNDPGYHGEPESQEYLANIYYDIITNWDSQ